MLESAVEPEPASIARPLATVMKANTMIRSNVFLNKEPDN